MLRITLVAYRERDPEVSPTVIDVMKQLYRDDNAISAHRARLVPRYGDTGDFTDYDEPPKDLYMSNIDYKISYDGSEKKKQLEKLIKKEDEALDELVEDRSNIVDFIFEEIGVKERQLKKTDEIIYRTRKTFR